MLTKQTTAHRMSVSEEVSIERIRNYWDRRPCNIRHSSRPIGTREYFNEVEARKYFVEPHIPSFADFPRWTGKKVLEIGCGIGTDTINFACHGAQVTAVDLSENSLKIARRRVDVFSLNDKVTFYQCDAEELTRAVPVDQYDLIYAFGTIHHTLHPEKVIGQLHQYARPGTVVKIMVYHRYSWKVLWIMLAYGHGKFWQVDKLVARHSEAQSGCPITHTYSPAELRRLLREFDNINIRIDHIFPYRIADYAQYRYVKAWYFAWMPPNLFHWLEKRFGWHLCVTADLPGGN